MKPQEAAKDAVLAQSIADTALMTAREQWLDAYTSLHGALEEAFPRQRAFVEAFFPKSKQGKKEGAPVVQAVPDDSEDAA